MPVSWSDSKRILGLPRRRPPAFSPPASRRSATTISGPSMRSRPRTGCARAGTQALRHEESEGLMKGPGKRGQFGNGESESSQAMGRT